MLAERELSEGVTERTVAALRKLAKEGLISREQKRRLLTDVISHHQQGEEASEVEIAYELLVMRFLPSQTADGAGSGSSNLFAQEEEDLLEDFADQVCVWMSVVATVREHGRACLYTCAPCASSALSWCHAASLKAVSVIDVRVYVAFLSSVSFWPSAWTKR